MNVPLKVLTSSETIRGILFSSSLHVIPKEVVLIAMLLCAQSSRETAVIRLLHIKRHLVSVNRFTETHIACVQILSGQKRTELACPAVHLDQLRKNKLMWILHI